MDNRPTYVLSGPKPAGSEFSDNEWSVSSVEKFNTKVHRSTTQLHQTQTQIAMSQRLEEMEAQFKERYGVMRKIYDSRISQLMNQIRSIQESVNADVVAQAMSEDPSINFFLPQRISEVIDTELAQGREAFVHSLDTVFIAGRTIDLAETCKSTSKALCYFCGKLTSKSSCKKSAVPWTEALEEGRELLARNAPDSRFSFHVGVASVDDDATFITINTFCHTERSCNTRRRRVTGSFSSKDPPSPEDNPPTPEKLKEVQDGMKGRADKMSKLAGPLEKEADRLLHHVIGLRGNIYWGDYTGPDIKKMHVPRAAEGEVEPKSRQHSPF